MKNKNFEGYEKVDQKVSLKITKSMNDDLDMLKSLGFNPSKLMREAVAKELSQMKQKLNLAV
ncbi:TPA: hypothetical protein QDB06_000865 [Burkholderia vietnamiensis]|nr:hypothetical protein [Burkholderia vietnamiensis]